MSEGDHSASSVAVDEKAKDDFPVKSTIVRLDKVVIVINVYSDRLLIFLSHPDNGGSGTLVQFRKEFTVESADPFFALGGREEEEGDKEGPPETVYDIRVLFGCEKPEILLAARVLGSVIHESGEASDLPIIFGIGLREFGKPLLKEIGSAIVEELKTLSAPTS